jgi:hypothetical protein
MKVSNLSDMVVEQLSIRIDDNSEELTTVRKRLHEMETTIPVMIATNEKNYDQLMTLVENQKKFDDRIIQIQKELSLRISEAEKITNGVKFAVNHWKSIFVVVILSIIIGFSVDNGLKDAVKIFMPEKVMQATKVITNG